MKTLVDTSVWVNHFRYTDNKLIELLEYSQVVIHEIVIGELIVGDNIFRKNLYGDLTKLPKSKALEFDDLVTFVETHKLYSKGLSWNDIQILAAALNENLKLYSYDKNLVKIWSKIN